MRAFLFLSMFCFILNDTFGVIRGGDALRAPAAISWRKGAAGNTYLIPNTVLTSARTLMVLDSTSEIPPAISADLAI